MFPAIRGTKCRTTVQPFSVANAHAGWSSTYSQIDAGAANKKEQEHRRSKIEALAQQEATEKPDDLVHCSFSPRCSLFCCFTHSAAVSSVTSKGVFLRIERFSPFRRGVQVLIWEQGHTSLRADIDPRVPAMTVVARKHRRHSDRRFVVSPPRTHPSFTPPSSAACSDDVATRLGFNKWSHKQATHVSRNTTRASWSRHFPALLTSSRTTTL